MSTAPIYSLAEDKKANFNQPLLDLKGEIIEHRFLLKEGEKPKEGARVEEEEQNGNKFKVQYVTLMISNVVGDALDRFTQEPPKPVGQVDYNELSDSLNKLLSTKKPKVKREDLVSVSKAVNKLQSAQALINEKTNALLGGKKLLMLARLAQEIYLSETEVSLNEEQIEFILKAVDKTNNGTIILHVNELLDPNDKLDVLS